MKITLPYKIKSDEEAQFVNGAFEHLADMMVTDSDRNPDSLEAFGKLPLVGTVMNLMDALQECEETWLMEENFDFDKIHRVIYSYDSICDEELEADDELCSIYFIHSFRLDLTDMLLESFIAPAIACDYLHKEWNKRHGNNKD